MEGNQSWLNLKVMLSIICIATGKTTHQQQHDDQMRDDMIGLPLKMSIQSLVSIRLHGSDVARSDGETVVSQHLREAAPKLGIVKEENLPVLSSSKETAKDQWIFTHFQKRTTNKKSMPEIMSPKRIRTLRLNFGEKENDKSSQVPLLVPFVSQSKTEGNKLRMKREVAGANPSLPPVRTTAELNTRISTTSDSARVPANTVNSLISPNSKLDIAVQSNTDTELSNKNVKKDEVTSKPIEGPDVTALLKSSVRITTLAGQPVVQGASQSSSKTSVISDMQLTLGNSTNSTESNQEALQTTISPETTSLRQQPQSETTQVPSQMRPQGTTAFTATQSSITKLPTPAVNTLPPLTNGTTLILIGSKVEDVHERMSGSELYPAYQWTSDAYWAMGSLMTVLLLLTAGVLCTGLLRKRNSMSNPMSDVTCHSPLRKRKKPDIKDFLKKKLRHIKTLNLKDSPLSGVMEKSKQHNGRRDGNTRATYTHRYDIIPLLERPEDDDSEEEFIEWDQSEKDRSV